MGSFSIDDVRLALLGIVVAFGGVAFLAVVVKALLGCIGSQQVQRVPFTGRGIRDRSSSVGETMAICPSPRLLIGSSACGQFVFRDDDDDDEQTNPFIRIDGVLGEYLFGEAGKAGRSGKSGNRELRDGIPLGASSLDYEEMTVAEIADLDELREVFAATLEEVAVRKIVIV